MQRSARIAASDSQRKLIVISATSGTTNNLVQLSKADISEIEQAEVLNEIEGRHLQILDKIPHNNDPAKAFEELFAQLKEHLQASDKSKKWRDALYAFGELISTRIFLQVLKNEGPEVEWLDARTVIKTDSNFGNAEPELNIIKKKVREQLNADKIYLTQGFIGSDFEGNTTTLGRGGSDFSAALFAEALNAETLEIWTDVAGIYTTDPRIVPDAFPIAKMSFDEAAELSVFGGKVLHPATLKPAIRANVNVRVASSAEPEKSGTIIIKETEDKPAIRAISIRKNQTLLTVHSLEMLHQPGYLAQLFKVLADNKISVDLVSTSEVSVALTLDTALNAATKVELNDEILNELRAFAQIEVEYDLALIALIGNNLHSTSGISGPLFMELEQFNIRLICYGASSNNLCFLTGEKKSEEIVKLLHSKFIQKSN